MRRLLWLVCVVAGLMSVCASAQGDTAAEAERLVGDASGALDQRAYDEAVRLCDQAIELDGDCHPAFLYRGIAREHLGDRGAAFDDYRQARDLRLQEATRPGDERIAADPGDAEGHLMRGIALHSFWLLEEARSEYELAASLAPGDVRACRRVVEITTMLGDADAAQSALQPYSEAIAQALTDDYENPLARASRAYISLWTGRPDDHEDIGFVREHATEVPEAAFVVAGALMVQGAFADALELVNAALRGSCEPWLVPALWDYRTICHEALGDFAAVLEDIKAWIRACPRDAGAMKKYVDRAVLLVLPEVEPALVGDLLSAAENVAGMGVALAPEDPVLLCQRGLLRRALGDTEGSDLDMADARRIDEGIERSPWIVEFAAGLRRP